MCHCSPAPPDCPPDVLINAMCIWNGVGEIIATTVVVAVGFILIHYIDNHAQR